MKYSNVRKNWYSKARWLLLCLCLLCFLIVTKFSISSKNLSWLWRVFSPFKRYKRKTASPHGFLSPFVVLFWFFFLRKAILLFGANMRTGVDEMINQASRTTQLTHKLYVQMRLFVEFLLWISSQTAFWNKTCFCVSWAVSQMKEHHLWPSCFCQLNYLCVWVESPTKILL